MRTTLSILLGLAGLPALAVTLPIAEDTVSNSRGVLTASAGKAGTLLVNTNQAALLKFDLSSLPAAFAPTNISSARIRFYVTSARGPGDLTVSLITANWSEAVITNTAMPSLDPGTVVSVAASNIVSKRFVTADVTSSVVSALTGSGPNFGFALKDTAGQTFIAAKEGPSQGPPAVLEIDANLSQSASGSGGFPGSLFIGGDLSLLGSMRQGSEIGTAEPAGRGIILRRVQSTNSTLGSIVARTDTVTLERDGTTAGLQIANTDNPGTITVAVSGVDVDGKPFGDVRYLGPNPYPAGSQTILISRSAAYIRISFGDSSNLGHHTEVSLTRTPIDNNPNWVGTLTSTYNQ